MVSFIFYGEVFKRRGICLWFNYRCIGFLLKVFGIVGGKYMCWVFVVFFLVGVSFLVELYVFLRYMVIFL